MISKQIVTIGGGISGLAATFYAHLNKLAQKYVLIEATDGFGGWIRTKRDDFGNLYETGPKTIRCLGNSFSDTFDLIDNLQIANQIVPFTRNNPLTRDRYIFVNGRLLKLPSSFLDLFMTKKPFSKPLIFNIINELFKEPSKSLSEDTDQSVYDFALERFGVEIADYIFSSLVVGICASDAKMITARLFLKEYADNGSVLRTVIKNKLKSTIKRGEATSDLVKKSINDKWATMTFKNGLCTLTNTLSTNLSDKSVRMISDQACTSLALHGSRILVGFSENQYLVADRLICALPANQLCPLIEHQFPELGHLLKSITFASVIVCNLVYNDITVSIPSGFGYLVPPNECSPILGVTFDSNTVMSKNERAVRLTVMLGGLQFDEVCDHDYYSVVSNHLKESLNISSRPDMFETSVLRNCIPQYNIGHFSKVKAMRKYIAEHKIPLVLCGASYDGISVNDVIRSAKHQVFNLISGE